MAGPEARPPTEWRSRWARRHIRADLVRDAGVGAAAPEARATAKVATRTGRQAAPLRARRGRGLQGAARHRRLADPRSGEAVPCVPGRQGTGRREGADQRSARRDAAAPAPVRPPPPLQRRGARGRPLGRARPGHPLVSPRRRGDARRISSCRYAKIEEIAMRTPFLQELDQPRPRLRRRDGDDAVRARHFPEPLVRRAEPDAAGSGRRSAPGLRARRRRRDRDQHLRRQPREARRVRPGRSRPRDQPAGGEDRAARRARPGLRRRRDRAARDSRRAVGQDRRRRSGGDLPRAGRRRSSKGASISSSSRPSATSTRSARRSARSAASATCRSSRR